MLSFITQNRQTPLMLAVWTGMREIVSLLVDHFSLLIGDHLNIVDNDGRSALIYAVKTYSLDPEVKNYGQIEVTQLRLQFTKAVEGTFSKVAILVTRASCSLLRQLDLFRKLRLCLKCKKRSN
jgi:hypothetical protein